MTYPDGKKYDGQWKDGNYDGKGLLTYPDGSSYDGEWKYSSNAPGNGFSCKHGRGIMTYPNGKKEDGYFEEGEFKY